MFDLHHRLIARPIVRALAGAALLSLAACQGDGASPQSDSAFTTELTTVEASTSADETLLEDVWSVRTATADGANTSVNVYELAPLGGDPAANGTSVVVTLSNGWEDVVFDTPLNVEAVTAVSAERFDSLVRVTIDVAQTAYDDATGALSSEQNSFLFEYSEAPDEVATEADLFDTSLLPDDEAKTDLSASSNPAYALLPSVQSVRTVEGAGVMARVFEVMPPGDPAYNGTYVFLTLSDFEGQAHTWDTGINVREIYDARISADGEIEIHTNQDVLLDDDRMGYGPVVFPARFGFEDGTLSSKLSVDLNPPLG